jgi:hypothetical protein
MNRLQRLNYGPPSDKKAFYKDDPKVVPTIAKIHGPPPLEPMPLGVNPSILLSAQVCLGQYK